MDFPGFSRKPGFTQGEMEGLYMVNDYNPQGKYICDAGVNPKCYLKNKSKQNTDIPWACKDRSRLIQHFIMTHRRRNYHTTETSPEEGSKIWYWCNDCGEYYDKITDFNYHWDNWHYKDYNYLPPLHEYFCMEPCNKRYFTKAQCFEHMDKCPHTKSINRF